MQITRKWILLLLLGLAMLLPSAAQAGGRQASRTAAIKKELAKRLNARVAPSTRPFGPSDFRIRTRLSPSGQRVGAVTRSVSWRTVPLIGGAFPRSVQFAGTARAVTPVVSPNNRTTKVNDFRITTQPRR